LGGGGGQRTSEAVHVDVSRIPCLRGFGGDLNRSISVHRHLSRSFINQYGTLTAYERKDNGRRSLRSEKGMAHS